MNQSKAYDMILDQAFARSGQPRQAAVTFILRFLPSFRPEEEIVLTLGSDSGPRVATYRAEESVWKKFEEASRAGEPLDLPAMVASVSVQRKQFAVAGAVARKWADQLLGAADAYAKYLRRAVPGNLRNENSILVDGTLYRLVIQTPQSDLVLGFSAPGTPTDENAGDPVAIAMARIRREVAAFQKKP